MDESIAKIKGKNSSLDNKLELEQCLMTTTDPHNLKFINESAKLDYTIFAPSSFNDSNMGMNDMFVKEEMNLAEKTMEKALTRKQNLEKKRIAPPLSSRDERVRKKKKNNNRKKIV